MSTSTKTKDSGNRTGRIFDCEKNELEAIEGYARVSTQTILDFQGYPGIPPTGLIGGAGTS